MTFEEAIRKSMRAYYKGIAPSELQGLKGKKAKYTKKYFDKAGSEYGIEPVDLEKKNEKGKKSGY